MDNSSPGGHVLLVSSTVSDEKRLKIDKNSNRQHAIIVVLSDTTTLTRSMLLLEDSASIK